MIFSPHTAIARLVTRLATALAVLVALLPVSVFGLAVYFDVTGILDSNLRLQAIAVENVIHLQPEYWELNPQRLNASFERYVIPGEHFHIIGGSGTTVVDIGPELVWPSVVRGYPLHDFGREVGRLEAGVSVLAPSLLGLLLFLFSLGAAWLIWGPLRRLPLAALATADDALRRRDQYQRALLDNFPFAIWLKDTESRYLSVNAVFAHSFAGDSADALVGKDDFAIFPREIAERFRADDRAMLKSRANTNVEEELLVGDVYTWCETYKALVIGDDEQILGTVGFTRDITERKRVEAELDRHRNELEALVDERTAELRKAHRALVDTQLAMDKVGIGIRRVDNATLRIVYANQAGAKMLGYTVDEMLALSIAEVDPQVAFASLNESLRKEGRAQFESVSQTKDGRLIPVEIILHYAAASAEAPEHTIAFVTDITQRKLAEAHLRRLSQTVEQSLAGIVIFDPAHRIEYINPSFIKASGRPAEELIGKTPAFMRTAMHGAEFYEDLWQTAARGEVWLGEIASQKSNGELLWVQASISAIMSEAGGKGEILGYVGIMDDITERKAIRGQLQQSEERFRQAFVHAPFGIAVIAINGGVSEANPALCRLLGYGEDEIKALTLRQFFLDDPANSDPLALFAEGTSSSVSDERVCVHKDGRYIPVICTLSRVRDANSNPLSFIVQVEDISERKQVQLKDLATGILAAQERERARLSHELHDEIGQSLTALKITLKRAQQSAADRNRIEICLSDGLRMLEHLMDEVRSIAYRLRPSELDQLGLAAALRSHLDKSVRPLGPRVTLVENLGETRLPASLELCCFRVVQEALTNALRHARADHLEVSLQLELSQLMVSIKDNGVGFDVGRYLSSQQHQSSLGLIGMRERVAANGGQLQIRSPAGEGAEVVALFEVFNSPEGSR